MSDTDTTPDAVTEMRSLMVQMETLLAAAVPLAAADAYGNPSQVAAGELIESAWGNAVADRIVRTVPDLAALATLTPANGAMAVTINPGTVWTRKGGAWLPSSGVLPAAVYTKADQTIGTGGVNALGWTAATVQQVGVALESVGGANIILPYTGVYLVTLVVAWSVNVTGIRSASISNPTTGFIYAETAGPTTNAVSQACQTIQKFTAGDKVRATVFQNSGVTINVVGLSGAGNNTQIGVHYLGQSL